MSISPVENHDRQVVAVLTIITFIVLSLLSLNNFMDGINISGNAIIVADCIDAVSGMTIDEDTIFCLRSYSISSPIVVVSPGVTLDCNGASLVGSGTNNGISILSVNGVTFKDCNLSRFVNGIIINNSEETQILGVDFFNNTDGILAANSYNLYLYQNNIQYSSRAGIELVSVFSSELTENSIYNNIGSASGIRVDGSSSNLLMYNNIFDNYVGMLFDDLGSANSSNNNISFNDIYGNNYRSIKNKNFGNISAMYNYWEETNYTLIRNYIYDYYEMNLKGVVQIMPILNSSYDSNYGFDYGGSCTNGVMDQNEENIDCGGICGACPVPCIIPYNNMAINGSTTFCTGNYTFNSGINITGDYSYVDCNNSNIYGNGSSMILIDDYDNVTLTNCNLFNYTIAVHGVNNKIIENQVYTTFISLRLFNSSNTEVKNNYFECDENQSMCVLSTFNTNSTFLNNIFIGVGFSLVVYPGNSSKDIITNNIFNSTYGIYFINYSKFTSYNHMVMNNSFFITSYAVVNSKFSINATNNYWGTDKYYLINRSIYDMSKDNNTGPVLWIPYLNASPVNGGVSTYPNMSAYSATNDSRLSLYNVSVASSISVNWSSLVNISARVLCSNGFCNNVNLSILYSNATVSNVSILSNIPSTPVYTIGNNLGSCSGLDLNNYCIGSWVLNITAGYGSQFVLSIFYSNEVFSNVSFLTIVNVITPPEPPIITLVSPFNGTELENGTTSVNITIRTNVPSVCRYSSNAGFDYFSGNSFTATGNLIHSFNYAGLRDGNSYLLYFRCSDFNGSISNYFTNYFTVAQGPDVFAPRISNLGIVQSGRSPISMLLFLNTDEEAECRYAKTDMNWTYMSRMSKSDFTAHLNIENFSDNSIGFYYIRCKDEFDNENDISALIPFEVRLGETNIFYNESETFCTINQRNNNDVERVNISFPQSWSTIPSKKSININIDRSAISFYNFNFTTRNNLSNVAIDIASFRRKPHDSLSIPKNYIFKYIAINSTSLDNVTDVSIEFRIDADYMAVNRINPEDFNLVWYNQGSWIELTTHYSGQRENYHYYTSKPLGTGYFAITYISAYAQSNDSWFFNLNDVNTNLVNSNSTTCSPLWSCADWSSCTNSIKTRSCSDIYSCDVFNAVKIESAGCVMDNCSNNIMDGNELGVDCGGSCTSCNSNLLVMPVNPTCSDALQNGDELGVDCGGSCARCVIAACSNGILDGDELGVDCSGSCAPCVEQNKNVESPLIIEETVGSPRPVSALVMMIIIGVIGVGAAGYFGYTKLGKLKVPLGFDSGLLTYIEQSFKFGKTTENVVSELLSSGWHSKDVQPAVDLYNFVLNSINYGEPAPQIAKQLLHEGWSELQVGGIVESVSYLHLLGDLRHYDLSDSAIVYSMLVEEGYPKSAVSRAIDEVLSEKILAKQKLHEEVHRNIRPNYNGNINSTPYYNRSNNNGPNVRR